MAIEVIARRFVERKATKTEERSVNILGLTPLDFSVNGSDRSIVRFLEEAGYRVISSWAMGSTLGEMAQSGSAHVNLVVSAAGLGAAKALQEQFGTPYVVGVPIGPFAQQLRDALQAAAETGENQFPASQLPDGEIVVIGEGVTSLSLASAMELETGKSVRVICPTECDSALLRDKDKLLQYEEEIAAELASAGLVIADPSFRPICPQDVRFAELPTEAFSGRIYRDRIPDLVTDFQEFISEVL